MSILTKLPGLKEGSRIRNAVFGIGYLFIVLMILGAMAGPPADKTSTNTTDTTTPAPTATQQQAADQATQQQTSTQQEQQQSTEQTSPTAEPTATTQSQDSGSSSDDSGSGYVVKISYDGEWSGTIGGEGSMRSVQGSGTETFEVSGNPSIVVANAQKSDGGSGTLTIQIIKNGEVVKESTTSAQYGLAQVSYSSLDTFDSDESSKSPYSIRISYDGKWTGTVGGEGSMRTVQGSGTKTFPVKGDPFVVTANAQKRDGGSGTLTIQILKNGEVIKEATTDAEYGMASVSVTT
jgi:hypothetical protein